MSTVAQDLKVITGKTGSPFDDLMKGPARFDPDAWHAMNERDNQLIADAVLHGYTGQEYVYQFNIAGKAVEGISVIGARALAAYYGGIKARIVASVDKAGSLFIFKSFEPLGMQTQNVMELEDERDFYEVVLEISDVKTGNSIQVRKKEYKQESRRDGSLYERPHFDVIAESKAYRNAVLSIIPQDVVSKFKEKSLKAGHSSSEKTKDQLIEGAMKYASKHSIPINRKALGKLTYAQIQGLGEEARQGLANFKAAAKANGILEEINANTGEVAPDLSEALDLIREATKDDASDIEAVIAQLPEKDRKEAAKAWEDRQKAIAG